MRLRHVVINGCWIKKYDNGVVSDGKMFIPIIAAKGHMFKFGIHTHTHTHTHARTHTHTHTHTYIYIYIYRVIQEESALLWEIIV